MSLEEVHLHNKLAVSWIISCVRNGTEFQTQRPQTSSFCILKQPFNKITRNVHELDNVVGFLKGFSLLHGFVRTSVLPDDDTS